MRGGLLACIGLSAVAHAALVGYLAGPGRPGLASRAVPAALQVRVASSADNASPAALPLPTAAVVTGSEMQQPDASLATGAQVAAPQEPAVRAAGTGRFDESDFIPRPRLSVAPIPQQPVLLAWPSENAPPAGRYTAILSLFIDEQGIVRRVRVEGEALPPALRDQATAAFAGVRYSPGQVEGRDVKSRIRIEVSFEADAQMLRRGTGS